MNTLNRRTAGVLALSALMASSVGLAGCGTSTTGSSADAASSAATGTDQATGASSSYEVDCRRGIVNDPYPGLCHDYVDSNGNSICDLSEPDTSAASQTVLVSSSSTDVDDDTAAGGCPLAPCIVCGICANLG